ncbi:hypothetical protein OJAV_G00060420 [Oryzias javanicus]|uniref:Uncharacterized protein n=1 Tax=Oryzias javanicus TaxID=123683 RepID=A0A3S2Q773_ORYJA|nr:hypothetical protein OJAV_G00060420 [Oryzias javanicus]
MVQLAEKPQSFVERSPGVTVRPQRVPHLQPWIRILVTFTHASTWRSCRESPSLRTAAPPPPPLPSLLLLLQQQHRQAGCNGTLGARQPRCASRRGGSPPRRLGGCGCRRSAPASAACGAADCPVTPRCGVEVVPVWFRWGCAARGGFSGFTLLSAARGCGRACMMPPSV